MGRPKKTQKYRVWTHKFKSVFNLNFFALLDKAQTRCRPRKPANSSMRHRSYTKPPLTNLIIFFNWDNINYIYVLVVFKQNIKKSITKKVKETTKKRCIVDLDSGLRACAFCPTRSSHWILLLASVSALAFNQIVC